MPGTKKPPPDTGTVLSVHDQLPEHIRALAVHLSWFIVVMVTITAETNISRPENQDNTPAPVVHPINVIAAPKKPNHTAIVAAGPSHCPPSRAKAANTAMANPA